VNNPKKRANILLQSDCGQPYLSDLPGVGLDFDTSRAGFTWNHKYLIYINILL
jgi:hypothetical protein